jgi:hypothetical protein
MNAGVVLEGFLAGGTEAKWCVRTVAWEASVPSVFVVTSCALLPSDVARVQSLRHVVTNLEILVNVNGKKAVPTSVAALTTQLE